VDRYAARVKTNLGNSSLQLDGILFLGNYYSKKHVKDVLALFIKFFSF
jgi:hypothetical protein